MPLFLLPTANRCKLINLSRYSHKKTRARERRNVGATMQRAQKLRRSRRKNTKSGLWLAVCRVYKKAQVQALVSSFPRRRESIATKSAAVDSRLRGNDNFLGLHHLNGPEMLGWLSAICIVAIQRQLLLSIKLKLSWHFSNS